LNQFDLNGCCLFKENAFEEVENNRFPERKGKSTSEPGQKKTGLVSQGVTEKAGEFSN